MKQVRFTKQGYEKLKKEYEALLLERPAAVLDLKKARDMGDLSENGYYKAARMKLSSIDSQLRGYSLDLKNAVIINQSNNETVSIGNNVVLSNGKKEMTYAIVGDLEADPKSGKISLLSPIGRAIAGKKAGDMVTITTPSGNMQYEILKIHSQL